MTYEPKENVHPKVRKHMAKIGSKGGMKKGITKARSSHDATLAARIRWDREKAKKEKEGAVVPAAKKRNSHPKDATEEQ